MHELSLASEMVRIVQEQSVSQKFSEVKRIHLLLGSLSCVSDEAFRFAFDAVRTPLLEEAELRIEKIPATGQCTGCGACAKMWHRLERCESCGAEMLLSDGGDEIRIRELEVC